MELSQDALAPAFVVASTSTYSSGVTLDIPAGSRRQCVFASSLSDDNNEWTPLQFAALHSDVNAPACGYYGCTALQAATLHRNLEIVHFLLTAAADPNASGGNNTGRTALQLAAGGSFSEAVHARVGESASWHNGCSALQAAAGGGHTAPVRELFAMPGVDEAAEGGFRDVVELLRHAGASANAPPVRYKALTAVQGAATTRKLDVIDDGADVDAPGCYYHEYTAQSAVAERGSMEVVRRLLKAGADVRAVSGDTQRTALQVADLWDHMEVVAILGAAKNASN
ncbi:ankyrin repeat-containing domain protein [Mycena rosella]|uniref:Ankyrin repeat-containing domain protein n=1 Tax=Mycena rosella TaxID=1033263 RepID=A0AAD7GFS7_MYCRO|nr:ankyrin repeat-containing domain protein [Mycena rosella]